MIDNSNAWRMEPNVPLIVSQVNPDDGEWHEGIIANPNCSTMQLVPVLMALRDTRRHRAGRRGHLPVGVRHRAPRRSPSWRRRSGPTSPASRRSPSVYPHPIAFNALPEIDVFLENGYTREEWKVVTESRKILHLPELRLSCTAVRVPVFVSHSEAVHVETTRPMTPGRGPARVRGRARRRRHGRSGRPTSIRSPRRPPATDEVFVGRVRTDPSVERGLAFWVVSDNLRKGAATNAVEIAEVLLERGWVKARSRRAVPSGAGAAS